jgi:transcriptional regulator with XRE-family HTH domain
MKRVRLDGERIKRMREARDRGSTQKELAHEVRISERKLRLIENRDAAVSVEVADRLARSLGQPTAALIAQEDGPPSPPPSGGLAAQLATEEVLPRFDTSIASAVKDEHHLFGIGRDNRVVLSHVLTTLTTETTSYAEELLSILQSLTSEKRDPFKPLDGLEELGLRRRLRELLVLLKGNDVWVYVDSNIRTQPESFEIQPKASAARYEMQGIVAFGPPGEYGETSIKVPIDRGRPCIIQVLF